MKILAAVDGSKASRRAAEVALELAECSGADLHFMTVVKPGPMTNVESGADRWQFSTADRGESKLREFIEDLQPEVEYTVSSLSGKAEKQIRAECNRLQPDMLVLGSDHIQGAKRLLGSVAAEFVHHPPCSVLLAK